MRPTASHDFNAYHKWLGILPSEQPAHHYRLLGIALFESDPEVVAAAADRQMAHIKSFAAGRYAAESQALLNELARARVTLLNDRQKQTYDRSLQQLLANNTTASTRAANHRQAPVSTTSAPVSTEERAEQPWEHLDCYPDVMARRSRRRRNGPFAPIVGIAIGLAAIGACLYYAATTRPSRLKEVAEGTMKAHPNAAGPPIASKPMEPDSRRVQRAESTAKVAEQSRRAQVRLKAEREDPLDPTLEPEAQSTPPANEPKAPKIAHVVDLDLENRRPRHALKGDPSRKFRVVSIQGFDDPYLIKPKDGYLDKTNKVAIKLSGARDVVINVSLIATPQGDASIILESHFITEAGDDIPFTLPNLDRVCRQITKEGRETAAAIDDMESERSRLQAWINAPVLKPLAERGRARARMSSLDIEIAEHSEAVQALRGDLGVAESLLSLAEHLHDECAIEIEPWKDDGK